MRAISAAELLTAWEKCLGAPEVLRGATLLAAAARRTAGDTAEWPIARRDAELLRMRAQLFGNLVEGVAPCPKCGETAEVQFSLDRIVDSSPHAGPSRSKVFRIDGCRVRYRAPSSKDLATISALRDSELAKRTLLEQCIELVGQPQAKAVGRISDKVARSASEWITQDQSWAEVMLNLRCPACENTWQAPFDIASFLWREVDTWARKVLREIHTIADRYGWSEADILAMSASRRQLYMEMLDQ
jgi:hypothetical protein